MFDFFPPHFIQRKKTNPFFETLYRVEKTYKKTDFTLTLGNKGLV